jgi:hypothetical protein
VADPYYAPSGGYIKNLLLLLQRLVCHLGRSQQSYPLSSSPPPPPTNKHTPSSQEGSLTRETADLLRRGMWAAARSEDGSVWLRLCTGISPNSPSSTPWLRATQVTDAQEDCKDAREPALRVIALRCASSLQVVINAFLSLLAKGAKREQPVEIPCT